MLKLTSTNALIYLLIAVVIPITTLSILGLVFLACHAILVTVLLFWLITSAAGYCALIYWPDKKRERIQKTSEKDEGSLSIDSENIPTSLEPQADWTTKDLEVWNSVNQNANNYLSKAPAWEKLPDICLYLLSDVSSQINQSKSLNEVQSKHLKYRFTVPELLLVLAITSHRYRELVLSHIPFVDRVKVSSLLTLYEQKSSIGTAYTWLNRARRVIRLGNPVAAAVGELREQLTDRVFNQLSDRVQHDLKRLLLQELIRVGIDLYSGKLKTSPIELQNYKSSGLQQDAVNKPVTVEPLRIALLGQSSSGKSSLINALANSLRAEIDVLPSTAKNQTHVLNIDDDAAVHVIDSAGLNGSSEAHNAMLENALNADIIIFLARATQPARGPDQQLYADIKTSFEHHPARRMPPLILVLSHIDQLSPKNEWTPPYNLSEEIPKSINIKEALKSTSNQIGLPTDTPAIPVCLSSQHTFYNIDAVSSQIMNLQDSAILAQWNRRRVEAGEQTISWSERWEQMKKLGQVLGKTLKRNI